jgi:hypothetical protein
VEHKTPPNKWNAVEQSLAKALTELRSLCAVEGYILDAPQRVDRANDFAGALDDVLPHCKLDPLKET